MGAVGVFADDVALFGQQIDAIGTDTMQIRAELLRSSV